MAIEWSESLSTGVDWQDAQHKELFRRINALLDAMNVGMGKEEVSKLFTFLDEYFVVHFDAEEKAMHQLGYGNTLAHLAEHTRFIEDVSSLAREASEGVTTSLLIKVQRRVVDWLINHIGGIDKGLGAAMLKADTKKTTF